MSLNLNLFTNLKSSYHRDIIGKKCVLYAPSVIGVKNSKPRSFKNTASLDVKAHISV